MSEHVTEWISAYHDGELHGLRLYQVESHLQTCAACQAELEKLASLSTLLQEAPAMPPRTAPNRFVAQVRLQLPPQSPPTRMRVLRTGWMLLPFGLLGGWAFLQAVLIVSAVLLLALPVFGILTEVALGQGLVQLFLVNVGLTVVLAILLWSWLAGWWVSSRNRSLVPASIEVDG